MKPNLRRYLSCFLLVALALSSACSDDDPSTDGGDADAALPDAGDDAGNNGGDDAGNNGGDDTGNNGGDEGFTTTTCPTSPAAAPSGETCAVTAGSAEFTLIHAGEVLSGDQVYEDGYVLVDNATNTVACMGCDCADNANAAAATVVSCADGVVSPALINTHDHITFSVGRPQPHGDERFEHRHDWRRGIRGHSEVDTFPSSDGSREGVLWGELRMLFGGATSVAGSGGADGLLRNLDRASQLEGLTGIDVDYSTFPLGDTAGTLRSTGCDYPSIENSGVLDSTIYLPHISEGIDAEARNEFLCLSGAQAGGRDLIEANTSIIHGIGLTATDIAEIAAEGAKLVWSPRSNIDLYGNTARVTTFKRFGVTIALGTDWSTSGSMNMLRELQCADYLNQNHYDRAFTDHELWLMATYNAAVAMGAENQLGLLEVGYAADITIFEGSTTRRHRAVIDADISDVVVVLRGGDPLYGDATVIEGLVPAAEIDGCELLEICQESRRVCVQRDTGLTLAGIQGAVHSQAYPLFFCGEPEDEPSCVPFRPMEYDGVPSAEDADGDGIADAVDLCPAIFTPVRPVDDGQPDLDADATGDDCDVCPLDSGETCESFDPNDRDGDGVANVDDNCPGDPNLTQEDGDADGIGDVCDPCPEFDNSATLACPASVYDIRDGSVAAGSAVFVEDVLVTAIGPRGFFVQVDPEAASYLGLADSGLYVFVGAEPTVARGDLIRLEGTVGEFGGEVQIATLASATVVASDQALPPVTEVAPADIATGGASAEALRATLVRVIDVTVTNANPDGPGSDFGEFEVTGGLRVDDELHAITPDPVAGDTFSSITGVLHFGFGHTKLEPRDVNDVLTGPATLTALSPAQVFAQAGSTNASTVPPLMIVLSGPTLAPTDITLTYSANVTGPAMLTVPQGASSIEVPLNAGNVGAATVTAALDGDVAVADVLVYDDATPRNLASVDPNTLTVQANGTASFRVILDTPAASGGTPFTVTPTVGGVVAVDGPFVVPPDQLSVEVTITAFGAAAQTDLTVATGATTDTVSVDVITAPPNCLILSEYIEGSGLNNKAIELYNCSAGSLDLSQFGVCLISNQNTSCSATATLGATTLPAGGVHTVCKTATGGAGDPVDGIKNNCDEEQSSIMNFNGDDRLIIFKDEDGNGSFNPAQDLLVDAFGEAAVRPPAPEPWKDVTLRRCNFTPYDGTTPFDVTDYYTSHPSNDAADYGMAPVEGC